MSLQWTDTAPSNIALIKYMGKKDYTLNLASNPSFSYTLPKLISQVSIETTNNIHDTWDILKNTYFSAPIMLSPAAQEKFLQHFALLVKNLSKYTSSQAQPIPIGNVHFLSRLMQVSPQAC